MATSGLLERDGAGALRKDLALLPARGALGAAMLYHGVEKLRSRPRAAGQFEQLGLRPGRFWAMATALAETFAGVAAVAGVLIRPAALAVLVTQAVAVAKVHGPKGFAATKGGYEYNLTLMALAAALLVAGPGRFSAHEAIEHAVEGRRRPRGWLRALLGRPTRRSLASALVHALG
jgi:putative oxidoreductase